MKITDAPDASPTVDAPPTVSAPASILERLRSCERPPVDPALAGGLREWIEDELADAVAELPPSVPRVSVAKGPLSSVLLCEAHALALRTDSQPVTREIALGSLVDVAFRAHVTSGLSCAGDDPLAGPLAALAVSGERRDSEVVALVASLTRRERDALAAEVAAHSAIVERHWQRLPGAWLPRTQDRVRLPFAGGRVTLAGTFDLVLGAPAAELASVCIVEVKSGKRRVEHRADLHFYALLETLRSGAPPFRVATFYTSGGDLDVEAISEDILTATVRRVIDGTLRLCRLAAGSEPERTPNPLCPWCSELATCAPGQKSIAAREEDPSLGASPGAEASWG